MTATYAGAALNRCARLRGLAHGRQVLVSSTTRDLVVDNLPPDLDLSDFGLHRLRDLSRPERVWQLDGPGLVNEHPRLRSLEVVPNNLPVQLSSFVGRHQEIDQGAALLAETRLLTLTGAGGAERPGWRNGSPPRWLTSSVVECDGWSWLPLLTRGWWGTRWRRPSG